MLARQRGKWGVVTDMAVLTNDSVRSRGTTTSPIASKAR